LCQSVQGPHRRAQRHPGMTPVRISQSMCGPEGRQQRGADRRARARRPDRRAEPGR
jgi:hypothetical protein